MKRLNAQIGIALLTLTGLAYSSSVLASDKSNCPYRKLKDGTLEITQQVLGKNCRIDVTVNSRSNPQLRFGFSENGSFEVTTFYDQVVFYKYIDPTRHRAEIRKKVLQHQETQFHGSEAIFILPAIAQPKYELIDNHLRVTSASGDTFEFDRRSGSLLSSTAADIRIVPAEVDPIGNVRRDKSLLSFTNTRRLILRTGYSLADFRFSKSNLASTFEDPDENLCEVNNSVAFSYGGWKNLDAKFQLSTPKMLVDILSVYCPNLDLSSLFEPVAPVAEEAQTLDCTPGQEQTDPLMRALCAQVNEAMGRQNAVRTATTSQVKSSTLAPSRTSTPTHTSTTPSPRELSPSGLLEKTEAQLPELHPGDSPNGSQDGSTEAN